MVSALRAAYFTIPLIAVTVVISGWCRAVTIADGFSGGGWRASNPKAPATVETSAGRLVLTDHPGGEVTWGSSCAKRFAEVDLAATPYAVITVLETTGGYGVKLAGGRDRPKRQVATGREPETVVLDIAAATGWAVGAGPLTVMLYTHADGSTTVYGGVVFTDSLTPEQDRLLRKQAADNPPQAPEFAGLEALAARRGDKPAATDPVDGERAVYRDPVTGYTIWRLTDHPAVERHVYYDIPAWNANGSTLMWLTRRGGGGGRYWLMDADGTHMRPLPAASDGGSVKSPFWSITDPNILYIARSDARETTVLTLDARNGAIRPLVSFPIPETVGERRFSGMQPPHPDQRHFVFRWGGQDRHHSLIVVVDAVSGRYWELEPGMPTHRVRFTKAPDHSVFINSNHDPDDPDRRQRTEWVLTLDGARRRLPPAGGHPDWTPDGRLLGAYDDNAIWLIPRDGSARRKLVDIGAGGHGGFSIATGFWHVGDAPRRGRYGNLVYVTEVASGLVIPIAYHGSSYAGWGSGVPDPEATHPAPVCSPDETKIVYDSDLLGHPDVWVAVWRRPQPPHAVRFHDGTLSWSPPSMCREIAGYTIYRKTGRHWSPLPRRPQGTSMSDLAAGNYAVAAREWSGLESHLVHAGRNVIVFDRLAPPAPGAPRAASIGLTHVVLELPDIDRVGVSHFNVYAAASAADGGGPRTLVGSPSQRRFVDWGLTPASLRHYRITAVDHQGNESLPGPALAVRTAPSTNADAQ